MILDGNPRSGKDEPDEAGSRAVHYGGKLVCAADCGLNAYGRSQALPNTT